MKSVPHLRLPARSIRLAAVALIMAVAATSCGAVESIASNAAGSDDEFVVQAYIEDRQASAESDSAAELDIGTSLDGTAADTAEQASNQLEDEPSLRGMRVAATDSASEQADRGDRANRADIEPAAVDNHPPAISAAEASAALRTVSDAAERSRAADSYRYELFLEIEGEQPVGDPNVPYVSGVASGGITSYTVDVGSSLVALEADGPINRDEMLLHYLADGSFLYINAPMFAELERVSPGAMFDAAPFAETVTTGWGRVDQSALGDQQLAAGSNPLASPAPDITEILAILDDSQDVRNGGTSSIRGIETTVLLIDVPFDDVALAMVEQNGVSASELRDVAPTTLELHLDADGRVRRMEWDFNLAEALPDSQLSTELSYWMRLDIFDFGEATAIALPDDAVDITDELIELSEQVDANGG